MFDQYEAWQRETIRRHGWALQAVLAEDDSPPFVYTVGLSRFEHPELTSGARDWVTSTSSRSATAQ